MDLSLAHLGKQLPKPHLPHLEDSMAQYASKMCI